MDIEQLKLVLETIKTITNDASTLAIWYFVLHYGITFLCNLLTVGTILGVVYLVATAFKSSNDDTALIKELANDFSIYPRGWVDDSDRRAIRKSIAELKAKANGNT